MIHRVVLNYLKIHLVCRQRLMSIFCQIVNFLSVILYMQMSVYSLIYRYRANTKFQLRNLVNEARGST